MRGLVRFVLWTAIALGIVAGVAHAVALRFWRVPDDDPYLEASLAPSLRAGDWLLLWRLTAPKYGDLVVCPEPGAPERIAIGRIAGEAGDRVKVARGQLWVNGRRAEAERACPDFAVDDPDTGSEIQQKCQIEVLGNIAHMRGEAANHALTGSQACHEVAPGNVFLVSDNRRYPSDSRDYGCVPRAACKETVVLRLTSGKGLFDVESRFTFLR